MLINISECKPVPIMEEKSNFQMQPFPFIGCFSLQRRHYWFSNWLIEPITAYCAVPRPSLPPLIDFLLKKLGICAHS